MPYYAAKPADIEDAVILIRINQRYRHGMSSQELYEATRGIWKLSPHRAERATYAFALFEGIVREVYEIEQWHPAGTLEYETRELDFDEIRRKRWEFEGYVAPDEIRNRYVGCSVAAYLPLGAQNPIRYVNC